MLDKYRCAANNLTLDSSGLTPLSNDAAVTGLPFLPHDQGGFFTWLDENLRKAEDFGIDINICIAIFAESWPCSWQLMLEFWGRKSLRAQA